MRMKTLLMVLGFAGALSAGSVQLGVEAADHGDAPGVRVDPRLDIPDVYAFQSPSQPGNVVFIMTLSPLARIVSQNTFHPTADHDFFVNTNADPDYEFSFNFRFGPPGPGGIQQMLLVAQSRTARLFDVLASTQRTVELPNGGFMRANEIDDPFFFDFIAFRSGLGNLCGGAGGNTGVDFFRGLNVTAIALEVPRSMFGTNNIGVWARTALDGQQIDRNGRPVINTVFVPGPQKDLFNQTNPIDDLRLFRDTFITSAMALGNNASRAAFLADFLLPDILTLDTSNPGGFPNGRRIEDDVIDTALNLVSNGALTRDCVANNNTLRTAFPYWGPPNP